MSEKLLHKEDNYFNALVSHYKNVWNKGPNFYLFDKGPIDKLPHNFRVLEFEPDSKRNMWTYATCCMSNADNINPLELHIFSAIKDTSIIELLTAVAYYHNNTNNIALNHVINFGRPWQDMSICEFGFISLPYLDGPILENFYIKELDKTFKFFWLIPITNTEFNYRIKYGAEALEIKFQEKGINYIDSKRESVV